MSLEDRTNETIPLSMEYAGASITTDVDSDSYFDPTHWVTLDVEDGRLLDASVQLTYDEAGLLHDRLGLILGRDREGETRRTEALLAANDDANFRSGDVVELVGPMWLGFTEYIAIHAHVTVERSDTNDPTYAYVNAGGAQWRISSDPANPFSARLISRLAPETISTTDERNHS